MSIGVYFRSAGSVHRVARTATYGEEKVLWEGSGVGLRSRHRRERARRLLEPGSVSQVLGVPRARERRWQRCAVPG